MKRGDVMVLECDPDPANCPRVTVRRIRGTGVDVELPSGSMLRCQPEHLRPVSGGAS